MYIWPGLLLLQVTSISVKVHIWSSLLHFTQIVDAVVIHLQQRDGETELNKGLDVPMKRLKPALNVSIYVVCARQSRVTVHPTISCQKGRMWAIIQSFLQVTVCMEASLLLTLSQHFLLL